MRLGSPGQTDVPDRLFDFVVTRLVIPPVTNDFIALFKDTAVCSVITVVELSKEYSIQARSTQAIIELHQSRQPFGSTSSTYIPNVSPVIATSTET